MKKKRGREQNILLLEKEKNKEPCTSRTAFLDVNSIFF